MGRENGLIVSSAIPPDFLPTCSFSRLLLCCVCLSVLQNLLVELRANQARRHCEPNGNPTPPSSLGPIRFALRGNGTVSGGKRMCFELAAKIFNMQVYSFQLSFSCLSACGLGLMKSRALKECCTQHLHTLFSRFSSTSESNWWSFWVCFLLLLSLKGAVGSSGSLGLQINDATQRSNHVGVSEYTSPLYRSEMCLWLFIFQSFETSLNWVEQLFNSCRPANKCLITFCSPVTLTSCKQSYQGLLLNNQLLLLNYYS